MTNMPFPNINIISPRTTAFDEHQYDRLVVLDGRLHASSIFYFGTRGLSPRSVVAQIKVTNEEDIPFTLFYPSLRYNLRQLLIDEKLNIDLYNRMFLSMSTLYSTFNSTFLRLARNCNLIENNSSDMFIFIELVRLFEETNIVCERKMFEVKINASRICHPGEYAYELNKFERNINLELKNLEGKKYIALIHISFFKMEHFNQKPTHFTYNGELEPVRTAKSGYKMIRPNYYIEEICEKERKKDAYMYVLFGTSISCASVLASTFGLKFPAGLGLALGFSTIFYGIKELRDAEKEIESIEFIDI